MAVTLFLFNFENYILNLSLDIEGNTIVSVVFCVIIILKGEDGNGRH
ncbi:hypothetical protein Clocl_0542 [Acetivibrio clariflavus DSM 19732]|uniref:Uncharacterized protein n=1 Tax=Acetivibrio clariflavus (strain DSM 19732 / NBRC 101661 / EBR45) TaxID=720554 RepID=G8LT53_ACECE|nr:hypothetical protein Clocl_0542 [Acetivibrio clariflavus DSM 19732]